MHSEANAWQEAGEEVFHHNSLAAYPQLCGSWPGDDWPEEKELEPRGDFAALCACSPIEYEGEIWPGRPL